MIKPAFRPDIVTNSRPRQSSNTHAQVYQYNIIILPGHQVRYDN